jgi:hypothetical protein
MAKVLAPVIVLLGVVVAVAGLIFQASGAAAVVYCSVVGGGLVLIAAGAVIWSVHTLRDRKHRKPSSAGV